MKKQIFLLLSVFFLLGIFNAKAQYFIDNSCSVPWDDIHTTGTALNISDDGEVNITLPFTFYLDGLGATNLRVGNNGGVLFNATVGDISAGNSALTTSISQGFYAFWDDIDDNWGNVYWQVLGTAPNRRLVVEWYQRPHYSGIDTCTFETILFEGTNQITFLYQDVFFNNSSYDYGASASIGIVGQNDAYQYSYNTLSLNGITCINYLPIQHDLQTMSVDNPLSDCGLGSDTIKTTIQNNAGDTAVGFAVSYSIDGGTTWHNEICSDTVFPYSIINYTFNVAEDFSTTGNYDMLVAVSYTNDEVAANDTIATVITNAPVISSFPYLQDFEADNGYWAPEGSLNSWEWGVPAGTTINFAASGTNAWVTNLTGNYNNNEISYLYSPCFDFTSLVQPIVALEINFQSYASDGALLQSSIDGGASWQTVGAYGDPNNWYNFSNTPPLWSGQSYGWLFAKHEIASLAGQPSVKFRMVFISNSTNVAEGFAFDDFQILESPANDLMPLSLDAPSGGCGMTASDTMVVEIFNAGIATQDTFDISYSIDSGATWITETYLDTIGVGDTLIYFFIQTADFSFPGDYDIFIAVNNVGDAITSNDTISTQITAIPTIASYPYFEDFESGDGGWIAGGTNSSWELGTPAGTNLNTAYSGINSWMTGLSTNYNNSEESYVESPCLDFTSLVQPILELSLSYYTESIDGAYIEYSTDGGGTWAVLGVYGDPDNWYNNTGNRWAGTYTDWVVAKHELTGLGGQSSVKLRVHFYSDGSVIYDGFAFDDIRIYDKPANDLIPLALVSPSDGCGMTANDTLTVQIFNNGIAPQDTFDISYSIDSGLTWVTETYYDTLGVADTLTYSFLQTADFSVPGNYFVLIAVNNIGDALPNNDTMFVVLNNTAIISYPYQEDFESFTVGSPGTVGTGWSINPATGYTWYVDNGGTPSSSTGPTIDHTLGNSLGIYMYTEASSGNIGNEADLVLHCLDMSSLTLPQLSFWYHMYGSDIDRVVVDQAIGGIWYPVDSLVGQQQTLQTDDWLEYTLNLNNAADSIRFRAIHGASYPGDIAIDDILIQEAPSNDIAMVSWDNPLGGCGLTASDTITITVENMGYLLQDSIPVSYSIDSGLTWVNEMIIDTVSPGATYSYSFSTPADFSALGHFYCLVSVANPGDSDFTNDTLSIDFESVPLVSSFPYFEDFESGNGGWVADGTLSTWELGTPAGTTINTAASGVNSWMTNLTGYYNNSENSWVIGPCFDFSGLTYPMIEFSAWVNSESSYDGAALQYSLDGGTTWNHVGSTSDPQWYNGTASGLAFSGNNEGFVGSSVTSWHTVSHALDSCAGHADVKLRIVFGSDGSINSYDGFAFDDIHIYEGTFPDLAVVYPYDNDTIDMCQGIDSLIIGMVNVGSGQVDSGETVYLYYQINGGSVNSDNVTLNNTLGVGDTLWATFSYPYNFSIAGTYSYLFYISYNNDNNLVNDTVFGYFAVDVCVGFEENELTGVSIYPNPNNGKFIIELPIMNEAVKIEIVSLTGQVLSEKVTNNLKNEFDFSNFERGIYFIRITGNKVSGIKKVVIE